MSAPTAHIPPLLTRFPYGTVEASGSEDDLLRPSLRKAFPLPRKDDSMDQRFRLVLDAMRRCRPAGR